MPDFTKCSAEELARLREAAFSAYYAEATRPVDWRPGMRFPELERATKRLDAIDAEIARRNAI